MLSICGSGKCEGGTNRMYGWEMKGDGSKPRWPTSSKQS